MSPGERAGALRRLSEMGIAAFRRIGVMAVRIAELERQLESARRTAEWLVTTGRPEPRLISHTPEAHPGVYVAGSSVSPELSYNQGPNEWVHDHPQAIHRSGTDR